MRCRSLPFVACAPQGKRCARDDNGERSRERARSARATPNKLASSVSEKRFSFSVKKAPLRGAFFTEKEGFEPSIRVSPYAGLANRCLKPLGHLSQRTTAEGHANVGSAQPAERAI